MNTGIATMSFLAVAFLIMSLTQVDEATPERMGWLLTAAGWGVGGVGTLGWMVHEYRQGGVRLPSSSEREQRRKTTAGFASVGVLAYALINTAAPNIKIVVVSLAAGIFAGFVTSLVLLRKRLQPHED